MKKNRGGIKTIIVFLVASLVFILPIFSDSNPNDPPEPGDGPDYDAIAYQLSLGQGFSIDWDNANFTSSYIGNEYKYLQDRSGFSLTSYRPPLFPFVVSGFYRIFGRIFYPVRIFNSLLLACVCSVFFLWICNKFGRVSAYLFVILFLFDPNIQEFAARSFLTEPLAVFLVAFLTLTLFAYSQENKFIYVCLSGLILGLLVLNRTIFILWIPFIFLFFLFTYEKFSLRNRFFYASTLVIISFALQIPWIIRNCIIHESFVPFGTQGGINLPAAYSEKSLAFGGVWYNLDSDGFYDHLNGIYTGLDLETQKMNYGNKIGYNWIRNNLIKMPKLIAIKSLDLWTPRTIYDLFVLIFFITGVIFFPNCIEKKVILLLLVANTLSVGLTWSVGTRFMIPVVPLVLICVCGATEKIFQTQTHFLSEVKGSK